MPSGLGTGFLIQARSFHNVINQLYSRFDFAYTTRTMDKYSQYSNNAPATYPSSLSLLEGHGAAQHAAAQQSKIHPVPAGLSLTEEEMAMWRDVMRAKVFEEWKASHLYIAVRAIKLETIIRRCEQNLQDIIMRGADPAHPDSIASEYMKNLSSMSKTQLGLWRSIGLVTASVYQAKTNSRASQAAAVMEDILDNPTLPAFLARPS